MGEIPRCMRGTTEDGQHDPTGRNEPSDPCVYMIRTQGPLQYWNPAQAPRRINRNGSVELEIWIYCGEEGSLIGYNLE